MKVPDPRRLFLYLLISSVAISAAAGIFIVLFGDFGDFEIKVLLTTLTVSVTSILGLACGASLEARRARLLPMAGISFAVLAAILWITMIWYSPPRPADWFPKSTVTATLLAAACSHLSLLYMARLERKFLWSRYAVTAAIWGLVAFLLYMLWLEPSISEDLSGRIIGVTSIAIAALTVITPVFHKLSGRLGEGDALDAEIAALRQKIEELEAKKMMLENKTNAEESG
ncbi:MAG TPA: hypothetical protein DEA22_04645 [Blastocatellia bacterium]|nr:hypothetical protein [Blastocatellia bacterium]